VEALLSEENLASDRISVLLDIKPQFDTLLVSFGGIANQLPIPVFEFMRSLDKFRVNKIFVRDFSQNWYTGGIKGVSNNLHDTIKYLEKVIEKYGFKKTIFLGNSAGGYAAMLFGRLLNVEEVHAFSPQTFLDSWNRLLNWDRRWSKQISNLKTDSKIFFDLKNVFRRIPNHKTRTFIYWDTRHRLDNRHALRMRFPLVEMKPFNTGGHTLIKQLKRIGELDRILSESLS